MIQLHQAVPDAQVPGAHLPTPPSERGAWLLALALGGLGLAVLVAVLTGVVGRTSTAAPRVAPPAVLVAAVTPTPSAAQSASVLAGAVAAEDSRLGLARADRAQRKWRAWAALAGAAIVAQPSPAQQQLAARRLVDQTETAIPTRWMEGFYPIYATAQSTFGVNWLLIASIHKQESAFSTAPTTYHGLNFAGCCGGPMQFNVTNGPVTHLGSRERLLQVRQASGGLRPHDADAPVDLRRLRLDHGRRPSALGGRCGIRAERRGVGRGV